jgi:hypothetical protein
MGSGEEQEFCLGNRRSIRLSYGTELILLKNFWHSNFWLFFGSSTVKHVFGTQAIEAAPLFYNLVELQTTASEPHSVAYNIIPRAFGVTADALRPVRG